jgi:hypothetical protein
MTDIATKETVQLIASDKVEGTAVYNPNGDRLGTIANLMVDKLSGQVDYAVMSFGGFLGIGEDYYPLPWNKLKYSPQMGGYVVDLDKRVLDQAPRYSAIDRPDWSDRRYTGRIDDYWANIPPV